MRKSLNNYEFNNNELICIDNEEKFKENDQL